MKNFTAGERRGLILLIVLLACILLGKLILDGRFSASQKRSEGSAVKIEASNAGDSSVVLSGSDSLMRDSLHKHPQLMKQSMKGRTKKQRVSEPVKQRSPLDEAVN